MARTAPHQASWWLPLVLALVSMVVSGYVGYSNNDKVLSERVAKLEAHGEVIVPRLERIENKIDELTNFLIEQLRREKK